MSTNDLGLEQIKAIENIKSIYQKLAPSNLVAQFYVEDQIVKQWDHLPEGDVKDFKNHTQYYYHSHSSKDNDRVPEHGHFHIFLRKPRFGKDESPIFASKKYDETKGEKDNLVHVCAIAMNEYGIPTALFTVNYWITLGAWYSAERIIRELDTIKIEIEGSSYMLVNQWMTSMFILFKPYIADLLYLRDEVIADFAKNNPDENVYMNKKLEVTSVMRLESA